MARSDVPPTCVRDASQCPPRSFAFRFETRTANGTKSRLSVHSDSATSPVLGCGHGPYSGDSKNDQRRERRCRTGWYSQRKSLRQAWSSWPTEPAIGEHVAETQRFRNCCRTTLWNQKFRSSNPEPQWASTTLRARRESWPLSPRGATYQDRRPRRLEVEVLGPPGPLRNQRPSPVPECVEGTFVPRSASPCIPRGRRRVRRRLESIRRRAPVPREWCRPLPNPAEPARRHRCQVSQFSKLLIHLTSGA